MLRQNFTPSVGAHISPKSKTVLGRSLTIKQIFERHKNGLQIATKEEYYEDPDFDTLSNAELNAMDIAEQHQYLIEQQQLLQRKIDETNRKKKELEDIKKQQLKEVEELKKEVINEFKTSEDEQG